MFTLAHAKTKALRHLLEPLDERMGARGFSRTKKGFDFTRRRGGVSQALELGVQRPNNSMPTVEGLIQPWVELRADELGPSVVELAGGKRLAPDDPGRILRVPSGLVTEAGQALIWRPEGDHGWQSCAQELGRHVEQDVLPWFERYSSIDAISKGLLDGDPSLRSLEDAWIVKATVIVAAGAGAARAEAFARTHLAEAKLARRWPKLVARMGP